MAANMDPTVAPQHFNIVTLETVFMGLPPITVPAPHTFTLTTYERSTAAEAGLHLRDALDLANTTNLKLISAIASCTDTIDLACARRVIRVLNSPSCNIDGVAVRAVALYFACRRHIVPSILSLLRGGWAKKGTLIHGHDGR